MKATTVEVQEFRLRLARVLSQFPSVADLARTIGVSDNAVYKWLAGRGQPSVSNLVSLSRTAGVSLEWLATGREPAVIPHPAAHPHSHLRAFAPGPGHDRSSTASSDANDRGASDAADAADPSRASAAQAGPPALYAEYTYLPRGFAQTGNSAAHLIRSEQVVDSLAFKTEWLRRRIAAAPQNLLLVEVSGDAMEPTLHDSDLILVDLGEPRFKQDGVYALRLDGELVVKRLQRGPAGGLIIKSDNPAYQPTAVPREIVGILGRVLWAAHRI